MTRAPNEARDRSRIMLTVWCARRTNARVVMPNMPSGAPHLQVMRHRDREETP
jgi:hypothetical protein